MNYPEQKEWSFEVECMTVEKLWEFLNDGSRMPVRLFLTRNRVTMISVSFRPDSTVSVRLHEAWLNAPEAVLKALRTYLRSRKRSAWKVVSDYARTLSVDDRETTPFKLNPVGRIYDLREIMNEVNRMFFGNRVTCRIGWGRRSGRRRRRLRSIRYGSWVASSRTIRVNPLLDAPCVPREFIRYIVFHEMLHAVVPTEQIGDRRSIHSITFRRLEGTFPNIKRMKQLCRELLDQL